MIPTVRFRLPKKKWDRKTDLEAPFVGMLLDPTLVSTRPVGGEGLLA